MKPKETKVTAKGQNATAEFLTSQVKLNLDAVELVKEAREDFR